VATPKAHLIDPLAYSEKPLELEYDIILNLKAGGKLSVCVDTTMDTGAQISIISRKLVFDLFTEGSELEEFDEDMEMTGVTANTEVLSSYIMFEIENVLEKAYVSEKSTDQLIISRGALRRAGLLARMEELDATAIARKKKKSDSVAAVINTLRMKRLDENKLVSYDTCPISDEKFKICEEAHNMIEGHMGAAATYAMIKKRDAKADVTMNDVMHFIAYCDTCQRRSASAGHGPYGMTRGIEGVPLLPGKHFTADFFGPHSNEEGVVLPVIIGFIDLADKKVMLVPAPDLTTKSWVSDCYN